jgi:hypothetical protein
METWNIRRVSRLYLHVRVAQECLAVWRKGGGVLIELSGHVVAGIHLVNLVRTTTGGIGTIADENLQSSQSGSLVSLGKSGSARLVKGRAYTTKLPFYNRCCRGETGIGERYEEGSELHGVYLLAACQKVWD